VVANVHSGWRGSIQNIIGRTVDTMKQHFDCRPDGIIAGIGPSLGPCCAEFIHYETEIPKEFWGYMDSDDHFDFWAISSDQLMKAGVPEPNIESSQMCTRCRTDAFYSYRAEKITGRFAAVIGLK
jgi:copper oxidase (laccase) domain-containing protein